jgi:FAD binding domain
LLEKRGASEEMVRLGNSGLAGSVYGGGGRVFRLDFTQIDSRYDYVLIISQAETERILREAIAKQGAMIERGVELVGLSQDALSHDASPVKAVLRHADERLEQAQAPWLINNYDSACLAGPADSCCRHPLARVWALRGAPQHPREHCVRGNVCVLQLRVERVFDRAVVEPGRNNKIRADPSAR